MQITVELPDDLLSHPDPARDALEAIAIAGYRSGALSAFSTRTLLGIQSRYEFDGFLKQHELFDWSYDLEQLNEDRETFRQAACS